VAELTIPRLLRSSAARYGDLQAVADNGTSLTFAQLWDAALLAARAVRAHGICAGDRVAVWAPNTHRWIVSALGVLCAGATVVPINTRYRGPEARELIVRTRARALFVEQGFLGYDHLGALLRDGNDAGSADRELAGLGLVIDLSPADHPATNHSATNHPATNHPAGNHPATDHPVGGRGAPGLRAAALLGWDEFLGAASGITAAEAIEAADAVRPDDLSEIIFTSGTTGHAKGVMLAHGPGIDLYTRYGEIWGLRPGDRYLISLPFFHTGGNKAGIIASLIHGVTMVPLTVFDAGTAMAVIERERITVMNGPPTIFTMILNNPDRASYDLSSLRLAATGAAVVPEVLVERARSELPFENFITAYGLTECYGTATMCRATDSTETVARTNGAPLPGVELRAIDSNGHEVKAGTPGEVLIRGANLTQGYWQDPEATAAAIDAGRWLHTGDIGTVDPDGNLKITDRLKDLFIVGGFNVSPAEVEQTMARHPDVLEVAVVGVADPRLGEVASAYVIPAHGKTPSETQIIEWCRERLANFKVPRSIVFVEALPRNASGKVLRRELRARAGERAGPGFAG
jgi:acyl-CoA synthetase (AMP-forming)/AMP-acid ligase II